MKKDKEQGVNEFRYLITFEYNKHSHERILTSHENLIDEYKNGEYRFLIDTVEGNATSWIESKGLFVKGEKLKNVCLYTDDKKLIVCTSKLDYKL
ncbi:MAG: hypothetical protein II275_02140 [Bacteroidaceae bacterium]|nr:hypothetical protein [Bacteroidaceae bacterium]